MWTNCLVDITLWIMPSSISCDCTTWWNRQISLQHFDLCICILSFCRVGTCNLKTFIFVLSSSQRRMVLIKKVISAHTILSTLNAKMKHNYYCGGGWKGLFDCCCSFLILFCVFWAICCRIQPHNRGFTLDVATGNMLVKLVRSPLCVPFRNCEWNRTMALESFRAQILLHFKNSKIVKVRWIHH